MQYVVPPVAPPTDHRPDHRQRQREPPAGAHDLSGTLQVGFLAGPFRQQLQSEVLGQHAHLVLGRERGDFGVAARDQYPAVRAEDVERAEILPGPHIVQYQQAFPGRQQDLQPRCALIRVGERAVPLAEVLRELGLAARELAFTAEGHPQHPVREGRSYALIPRRRCGENGLSDAGHAVHDHRLVARRQQVGDKSLHLRVPGDEDARFVRDVAAHPPRCRGEVGDSGQQRGEVLRPRDPGVVPKPGIRGVVAGRDDSDDHAVGQAPNGGAAHPQRHVLRTEPTQRPPVIAHRTAFPGSTGIQVPVLVGRVFHLRNTGDDHVLRVTHAVRRGQDRYGGRE